MLWLVHDRLTETLVHPMNDALHIGAAYMVASRPCRPSLPLAALSSHSAVLALLSALTRSDTLQTPPPTILSYSSPSTGPLTYSLASLIPTERLARDKRFSVSLNNLRFPPLL